MARKPAKNETESGAAGGRKLSPAAARALAEAQERRKSAAQTPGTDREEVGGRDGLEPTRYGDWEKDGVVSDF